MPGAIGPTRLVRKRRGRDILDEAARARSHAYDMLPLAAVVELLRLRARVERLLRRVTHPTLVLHGRHDRTARLERRRASAAPRRPAARVGVRTGARAHRDAGRCVAARVVGFLSRYGRAAVGTSYPPRSARRIVQVAVPNAAAWAKGGIRRDFSGTAGALGSWPSCCGSSSGLLALAGDPARSTDRLARAAARAQHRFGSRRRTVQRPRLPASEPAHDVRQPSPPRRRARDRDRSARDNASAWHGACSKPLASNAAPASRGVGKCPGDIDGGPDLSAIVVGFFALSWGFVVACDRLSEEKNHGDALRVGGVITLVCSSTCSPPS
jgi:hypothetical protein